MYNILVCDDDKEIVEAISGEQQWGIQIPGTSGYRWKDCLYQLLEL